MLLVAPSLVLALVAPVIEPGALERHLDQVVPARLAQTGIPGVVVSVVQGDRVLLARGWGTADREHDTPMDGTHTVVRVASISKTFTASAVAQLEAQGRLDLDAPVDAYLPGVALPALFPAPITLRHLLSHTAGIINNNVGRVSRTPPVDGLAPFLVATMPPRVRPPGVAVVYSNHGNALAGLVVQQISGEPFADYVEHQILDPLQMGSSSFTLRPELADALATGYYTRDDGEPTPYEYLYFKTIPASTLHTTAADMAHFMVMHLQGGRFDGQPVLPPEADRRMRAVVPVIHPALPSYHYAFAHGHTAGHPTRSHGGSVPGFLSRLVLFDAHGVGVFVCQNAGGASLVGELVESIAARLLPAPLPDPVVPMGDGRPEDPAALVGDYRRLGKGDTPAFTRPLALLWPAPQRVGVDAEGFLTVDGDRFVRTGARVFQRAREGEAPEVVVFVADDTGAVRWIHRGLATAERPAWYDARWVHLLLVGLCLLVLLAAALRCRGLLALAARMSLVGLVVPYLTVAWIDAGQEPYLRPMRFGMPGWLAALRWLVPAAAALAWVAAGQRVRGRGAGRGRARASVRWAVIVALAATAVPLWEWYWSAPEPGLVERS